MQLESRVPCCLILKCHPAPVCSRNLIVARTLTQLPYPNHGIEIGVCRQETKKLRRIWFPSRSSTAENPKFFDIRYKSEVHAFSLFTDYVCHPPFDYASSPVCCVATSVLQRVVFSLVCTAREKLVSFLSTRHPMKQRLIRATELAEFVYCSKAWHLKYVDGAEVSPAARELQAKANAWHIEQGRSLARGDSYRWAGFAALMLAIILVVFCWLGWAK